MKKYWLILLWPCLLLSAPPAHGLLITYHDVILYEGGGAITDDSVFAGHIIKDNYRAGLENCRNGRCKINAGLSEATFTKTKSKRSAEEWEEILSEETFDKVLCKRSGWNREGQECHPSRSIYPAGKKGMDYDMEDYLYDLRDYRLWVIKNDEWYSGNLPLP